MKASEAAKIKEELLSFCKKYGLWVTETMVRKPHLDLITVEISIKVERPEDVSRAR